MASTASTDGLTSYPRPIPGCNLLGRDATIVYNEPYTKLIGQKHPALQGQDPKIEFAEVWNHFEQLLSDQRETGESTVEANAFQLLYRHGFLEEVYFSWKFVPIIGDEGWVVGSHATLVEVTREVISDRRLSTVRSLNKELSQSKNIKGLWLHLIRGIEGADKDIPLALLYSVTASSTASGTTISASPHGAAATKICSLEGSIGIPIGHELAPLSIDLDNDEGYLAPTFRNSIMQMTPTLLPLDESTKCLLAKLQWRGHGVPSTAIVACPIIPTNSGQVLAFLVIGLNPRRPLNEDYRGFLQLLTQQVTTPQLSAVILREEIEKRQMAAQQEAIDRDRLSKELSESETKFTKFATRAPVGLAVLTPEGHAKTANDLWSDLTQLDIGSGQVSWDKVLADGELEPVLQSWGRLKSEKRPIIMQTRMKRPWLAPDLDADGNQQWSETHILLGMHPDLDENGQVLTVMSCVTDISSLKWSESQLRRRMDQAIEMKKQQERFIDMTSHEIRIPLAALIGCADEIITSLNDLRRVVRELNVSTPASVQPISKSIHLLDEAIEAAETIIYCAMHQKRIIDDILTLSKLDVNLLLVTPEPTQPIELIRSALKMFGSELKRAETKLDFIEQDSLRKLDIQWTLLDPSRVLQVLINLMTNSIKFTRTEARRHIQVMLGASLQKPSESNDHNVKYVSKNDKNPDQTSKPEWGDGEVVYLSITVIDTGRGLSSSEINNLFNLFGQANPKIHQTYGGPGLGLFISRQLVEMQGGEIGVKSETGKGCTFQFYIKTRRTMPVIENVDDKSKVYLMVREDEIREAYLAHTVTVSAPSSNIFHILVVEDNLVNQKVVTKSLRKSGHIVHVANHGEEALDFIRRSEYWHEVEGGEKLSVVLMDLEMPIMGGLNCVRRIRELQVEGKIKRHVPVIAVTANARKDQILASKNAGMDECITKPYRIQDMLKQIEELVTKHKPIS